ncbi:hypothetical protein HanRHA438_Chr16g0783461 [Helianthus annuus]|nr:hypothetical protein HanRHA438_Chr16g0783461 [Helianthus annuus]
MLERERERERCGYQDLGWLMIAFVIDQIFMKCRTNYRSNTKREVDMQEKEREADQNPQPSIEVRSVISDGSPWWKKSTVLGNPAKCSNHSGER